MASAEGYVLASYGRETYLHHALASARTIRRHDRHRPIALYCSDEHRRALADHGLEELFEVVDVLPETHQSIVGFKHFLHLFAPFERSLFADTDIVWCRDPDPLWRQLAAYAYTSTGDVRADVWFGAAKDYKVAADVLLLRRRRTLRRLGLTHLPRVLTALVYVQDRDVAREVGEAAQHFLGQRHLTHFQSRLSESGRTLESCEWSLALAMSRLGLPVYPWFRGVDSPLLDYYPHVTEHDVDFERVLYRLWTDRAVYDLQRLRPAPARRALAGLLSALPQRGDYVDVTPLALHFGVLGYKEPFYRFAERTWAELAGAVSTPPATP